ncbi:MAG: YceI family protein [Elusimicrobiota bacterium]|nr:MAG: YceI family protein [Elusimicrobiota bacterium]
MNIPIPAVLLLAPALAWSAAVNPGGFLRVEGDSTLHKWNAAATVLKLDVDAAEGLSPAAAVASGKVKTLALRIPAAGLESGDKKLDKNMRKAMKAEEFPEVVYTLSKYELAKAADGALTATTTGELTIAGVTKSVALSLVLIPGDGSVAVRGSHDLLMSDYGIAPPKLMMGTIKVRDAVTVRFDLILKTQKEN